MSKDYVGKGTIYVEEVGSTTGLLPLGNCSGLSLAFNEDKKEQKDYQGAGGAVVNTVSRIDSVVASITALDVLNPENLALALRGLVNTVAGGAVASEAHTAQLGAINPLVQLPDMSQTVTVTGSGATPTYTQGTDYTLANGGIVVIDGGTITAGLAIEVSYTGLASYNVEGINQSGKEYKVYFDGLNEADSGKPVMVTCHRVKFSPTTALELIGDEFANLPFTFDILKDSSIVGVGESQFIKLQTAQ